MSSVEQRVSRRELRRPSSSTFSRVLSICFNSAALASASCCFRAAACCAAFCEGPARCAAATELDADGIGVAEGPAR